MNLEQTLRKTQRILTVLVIAGILSVLSICIMFSPDLSETIQDTLFGWFPDRKIWVDQNIPYASSSENQQYLCGDLYRKENAASILSPAVIVVHGGSWSSGDKSDVQESANCRWLALHGFTAFSINYRLIGHGGEFPNDVADMQSAVAFLKNNCRKYNIDPNRIFLLGTSSGATGALLAAYTINRKKDPNLAVTALASFSGPSDLSLETKNDYVRSYLGNPQNKESLMDQSRRSSPIFNCGNAIPTICIHGTADSNVSINHSIRLCKKLEKQNVPCLLVPVYGGEHFIGSASTKLALAKVIAFFNSVKPSVNH